MRVIAFWVGLVALVVAASQGAIVGMTLFLANPPVQALAILYQVAAGAQIVLSLFLAVFFFGYAVTKRDS